MNRVQVFVKQTSQLALRNCAPIGLQQVSAKKRQNQSDVG